MDETAALSIQSCVSLRGEFRRMKGLAHTVFNTYPFLSVFYRAADMVSTLSLTEKMWLHGC